jgi:hypothetical protein
MAEMVGFSRGVRRSNGVVGGIVAALKLSLARLSFGRRQKLNFEEWPDYLLRDIGLDRTELDPHTRSKDWLGR